jgi:hypothetical protein
MSYIPRSSSTLTDSSGPIPKMVQKKRTFRAFAFLGTAVLACSLLTAGATYFYVGYAQKQLETAMQQLDSLGNNVNDQKNIKEIGEFDQKLKLASYLLKNHIAPSRIFSKLEELTKETVQFASFVYEYDPGFAATFTLDGVTGELSSVALQKIELIEDEMFYEMRVDSINTNASSSASTRSQANSDVTFRIDGSLDISQFKYVVDEPLKAPDIMETEVSDEVEEPTTVTSDAVTAPE